MIRGGRVLRERREALGLSLEQVAASTRIPLAHLQAIEADRLDDLPAGPYAVAYLRTLEKLLGTPAARESGAGQAPAGRSAQGARLPEPPDRVSLPALRWAAGLSSMLVVGLVAGLVWNQGGRPLPG